MPTQSNFPRVERDPEASWPSHTPVNASLKAGERLDSLGRVVPSRTNHPQTGYAKATASDGPREITGAAGYTPVQAMGWHHPLAPFSVVRR